jgi:transglutaminase-like putative cysteine protease
MHLPRLLPPSPVRASFRARLPAFMPLAWCFLAAPLAAQAPRITPKGDPSVKADTIYRLAVDPATAGDDPAVFLLDDGVLRFEADGKSSRTYRQIVQVLTEDAAQDYREQQFSWSPGHEKFTLNWIRVLKPDGTVISAAPTHTQDSDVPAQMSDPVYADRRVRRVSLSGVAPGTLVDYSFTTEETKPFLAGDFFTAWSVTTRYAVKRSRLVVDVPASLKVRIDERNLNFPRRTATGGGRTVMTWATADVPRIRAEPFAADSNDVLMTIKVSSPLTWNDIAAWYAGNAHDRYTLTPDVRTTLDEKVRGARTLTDSIRAVHDWVAQDIRYVSIALGLGGYQPRAPGEVLQTGYGDCKDKATFFVAALAALGVEAFPVLLSSSGGVDRLLPSIQQFDHVIAAVRQGDGYLYTDMTSDLTPYGRLPPQEQGQFGLVVLRDGTSREITFPQDSIGANRDVQHLTGTLDSDGIFTGHFERETAGTAQYGLRSTFSQPVDSAKMVALGRAVARQFFSVADADSVVAFNGKDLGAPPRFAMRVYGARAAKPSGDGMILTLPFGAAADVAGAAQALEEAQATHGRVFPIDAADVNGPQVQEEEFRVTLPEGWHARLPDPVTAEGIFGSYQSGCTQTARELTCRRAIRGARGIYPPSRLSDLIEFFREVGRDDARFIVLEKSLRS